MSQPTPEYIYAEKQPSTWDRVERVVSDWCDAYGGLHPRKQWLAQNGASYDLCYDL